MFLLRDSGTRCKECVKKDTKRILKSKPLSSFDTDFLGYNVIKEHLKDFTVVKMVEGCLIDIIIKPNNNSELYLPIQLKSTLEKSFGCYSFGKITTNKYKNMIIVLVCINEKTCWLLKNEDIDCKIKINIGNNSKKYGKFKVDIDKLNDAFLKLYKDNYNFLNTKDIFNIPINKYQIREQEYAKIRETQLDFINFIKPLLESQVYDFLIENHKIQEKVCGIRKGRNQYTCSLVKNYIRVTKDNVIKKHINYELGDNDFYWINIPDKNTFYIFPEKILYDMDKIDTGKLTTLNIPYDDTNYWTYKYKFYYDNPNKNDILKILNTKYATNDRIQKEEIIIDEKLLVTTLTKYIPEVEIKEEKPQPQIKNCSDCNIQVSITSMHCNNCNNKHKLKISIDNTNRPTLLQLKQDLKDLKYYVKVGEKYNVSDNCIRKWIRNYENMKT